jgi:hypothetical protein
VDEHNKNQSTNRNVVAKKEEACIFRLGALDGNESKEI